MPTLDYLDLKNIRQVTYTNLMNKHKVYVHCQLYLCGCRVSCALLLKCAELWGLDSVSVP